MKGTSVNGGCRTGSGSGGVSSKRGVSVKAWDM